MGGSLPARCRASAKPEQAPPRSRFAAPAVPWYAGGVPRFEPFAGWRYNPDQVALSDVVAPPYDVINETQRADLRARSPYNSVRIELPDADVGASLDPYQAAARRLADWQRLGVLRRDPTPALYGYQTTYRDPRGRARRTAGVIGALGLEPASTEGVFPHEHTTPKAKSDRLALIEATELNTSPIWGLSLAKGLMDGLEPPADDLGVVDEDGVRHHLWPIADPSDVDRLTTAISAAPVVIADGHHRFDTALTYRRQRAATADAGVAADIQAQADDRAGYDAVMALVVELTEDQLSVQGIHRLITGLPADLDLPAALERHFELAPTNSGATILDAMADSGALGLLTPAGAWLLTPRPETDTAAGADLDSRRLEVALAALPTHEVVYQHGFDEAAGAVAGGRAQAAVLLRPVTVEQIAVTARGGERMPPKTTFFWPKPRTGFVFRDVRD